MVALALVSAGDHILVADSAYGPLRTFAKDYLMRLGVHYDTFDPTAGTDIAEFFKPNRKLIFMESPGSVTMEMQDIPAIVKAAKAADKALNAAYAVARVRRDDAGKTALRDEQRAWIKSREASCSEARIAAERGDVAGDSAMALEVIGGKAKLTEARAKQLAAKANQGADRRPTTPDAFMGWALPQVAVKVAAASIRRWSIKDAQHERCPNHLHNKVRHEWRL